jgi:hypothetical protein
MAITNTLAYYDTVVESLFIQPLGDFFVRTLRISVISSSVCSWQAFPA